jgi:hypothetical protein
MGVVSASNESVLSSQETTSTVDVYQHVLMVNRISEDPCFKEHEASLKCVQPSVTQQASAHA